MLNHDSKTKALKVHERLTIHESINNYKDFKLSAKRRVGSPSETTPVMSFPKLN